MADTETLRRTPLHALHESLGGRLVPFAGWALPVQYPAGIMAEHNACRSSAALFDVSHMQQVRLDHADGTMGAAAALETLVPGGITSLKPGQARYTVFTNAAGGVLDDLIASHAGDHLFLVVNASRAEHDVAHMQTGLAGLGVTVTPLDRALVALQGPKAGEALARLVPESAPLRFMQTVEAGWQGERLRVSRLGYTGEDGFEISLDNDHAAAFAETLLAMPEVSPAGLGARDSLRLEAGLCLYGQDLTEATTPIEAGLSWTIPKRRREEGGYPGADVITKQLSDGPARKLVAILPEGRAPARAGTEIRVGAESIGTVTSGGFGPSVGGPVALGYVAAAHAAPGTTVDLIVRDVARPARIVPSPFVPHNYLRA
jgi:aminomethyltransferase